jgi:hypothetical protein
MKIELDLDNTYNQLTDDNQVSTLIDGPVHLIELSKTNVQSLLNIAHEVRVYMYMINIDIYFFSFFVLNSFILYIRQIGWRLYILLIHLMHSMND